MTVFDGPGISVPLHSSPVSNPLDVLAKALGERGVSVLPMLYVQGGARIGGNPDVRQIAWTHDDDLTEVADKITKIGSAVRFLEMYLPKGGVIATQTHKIGEVWARYVVAYDGPTDQTYGRWDVLIEPIK